MDHMGDWMLPGAALVLRADGIVLVSFDDIVPTLLGLRRKGADSGAADTVGETPREARARKRLRRKR